MNSAISLYCQPDTVPYKPAPVLDADPQAQLLAQQGVNAMYAQWAADAVSKANAYNAAKAAANASAVPGSYPTPPRGGPTPTCTTCYADDRGGNPWLPYMAGDEPGPGGTGNTNDTGGRGGGGGGGTTYLDPNIAKRLAALLHVATNLQTPIGWGPEGDLSPLITDRPNTVRADTDLTLTNSKPAVSSDEAQTPLTCDVTCDQVAPGGAGDLINSLIEGTCQTGGIQRSDGTRVRNGPNCANLGLLDSKVSAAAGATFGERLRAQLAGEEIAGGHAFDKHVVSLGEFPGVITRNQFANVIEAVIINGEMRTLTRGRTAFWDNGVVVIRNPGAADGGTAFRPTDGYQYFLNTLQ